MSDQWRQTITSRQALRRRQCRSAQLPPLPGSELTEPVSNSPQQSDIADAKPEVLREIALLAALGVVLVLAILGFLLPWITVDNGSTSGLSYAASDLPVGNVIGALWLALLTTIAIVGWALRSRWVLLMGILCLVPTVVVLTLLAVLVNEAPHLVPLWLIPKQVRTDIPAISSGTGPLLAIASSGLFLLWCIAAAIGRPLKHVEKPNKRALQRVQRLM